MNNDQRQQSNIMVHWKYIILKNVNIKPKHINLSPTICWFATEIIEIIDCDLFN